MPENETEACKTLMSSSLECLSSNVVNMPAGVSCIALTVENVSDCNCQVQFKFSVLKPVLDELVEHGRVVKPLLK